MLALLAALALTQVYSAPQPVNGDNWTFGEVPEGDVAWDFVVGWEVIIRPDGSIQECETTSTSGNPDVDDGACLILQKRARFRPAKAPDGTPMYGVFRGWTEWGRRRERHNNFKVIVDNLPEKIRLPASVDIVFLVDTDGRPSFCADQYSDDHPALVSIACERLPSTLATPAIQTEANELVPTVQNATAIFVTEAKR